jgi:heat-inducible transcriptional repressor
MGGRSSTMQKSDNLALDERSREILQWVISTFVTTGKPVGSRRIARRSREHLSAATVRNIMADLEEMGYLSQPHTSAGRLPTDKAYRAYVDCMLQRHEISSRDRALIDSTLAHEDSAEHLMERTSKVLSQVSNSLGIVMSPPISRVALEHIQFLRLSEGRILVVLISRAGTVQNRVVRPDETFSQAELDQAANYISEHFKGRTLQEIRPRIIQTLQEERARCDQLTHRVLQLSTHAFAATADDPPADVYLDGAANLIKRPEFSDVNRMRALFETMEQRSKLAALLSRCIEGDSQEVRITIGAENSFPGIEDCTLITSPYVVDERIQGSLGILGPTRMEYGKAISLVEYVARLFGRVLAHQGMNR